MTLHRSTFEYLKPTNNQLAKMSSARANFASMAAYINDSIPDGPDKTYALRKLREISMWVNIAITREADGTPREDDSGRG